MPQDHTECAVCHSKLPSDYRIAPTDFMYVCQEHDEYRNWPHDWMAKRHAGLPYVEPPHKCDLCLEPIDHAHWNENILTQSHRFLLTCAQHESSKNVYNIQLERIRLGIPNIEQTTGFIRQLNETSNKIINS